MIGRIVRPVDFKQCLDAPRRWQSTHFALHHVAQRPAAPERPRRQPVEPELSTAAAHLGAQTVDVLSARWLGLVVPKRHAKRSVTRNLLRRQMREAARRHEAALPAGMCVLRLKRMFEPARYPSASSPELGRAVRIELDELFRRALS